MALSLPRKSSSSASRNSSSRTPSSRAGSQRPSGSRMSASGSYGSSARSASPTKRAPRNKPSATGSVRRNQTVGSRGRAVSSSYVGSQAGYSHQGSSSSRTNSVRGVDGSSYARQNNSATPLHSSSVSQVTQERKRAVRQSKRSSGKARIIAIIVAVVLLACGIAFFVLYNSDTFKVEKVTVTGVEHITAEEMTELADIPSGSTLLSVDAGAIKGRLSSNPWVKDVAVERAFPDTINLNITERSIGAVVDIRTDDSGSTETWALATDGMWLTKIPDQNSEEGQALASKIYEDASAALRITDVPYGSTPEAGTTCENSNISNALGIIDGMSTQLAEQVRYVSASDAESTTLTLDNGIEVAFGNSENIRDKERVVLQLMEEHKGKITYINVRTPSNPIWRSL